MKTTTVLVCLAMMVTAPGCEPTEDLEFLCDVPRENFACRQPCAEVGGGYAPLLCSEPIEDARCVDMRGSSCAGEANLYCCKVDPPIEEERPCSPGPAFEGFDACWVPDEACCSFDMSDLFGHCQEQFGGLLPEAVVCTEAPAVGPQTDGRHCEPVILTNFYCAWGNSALFCCE